ncbi:MAG: hypothetical protein H8D34_34470 [Chloroflexi bacterium]|nr:hypothetical protein [Chloroflexota bacterium]
MLNYDFDYPEIPLIPDYPGISRHKGRWQRQALTLWLIAKGYSLRTEVQKLVAQYVGTNPVSGALMRVIADLRVNGI